MGSEAIEVRFRALAEAAPIGIFETDATGEVRYVNPAWQHTTGISLPEAASGGWRKMLHPDDVAAVVSQWDEVVRSPHPYAQRFRVVIGDEIRWVDAAVAPAIVDGRVCGFVGTLVDVSVVVAAEQSLIDVRDRALEASRLKMDFIANISHEIRTPLNGVLGLAQILSESNLDDRQRGYVQTMRRAGDDLLQLLNDVLDFSKIEAGAMRTETVRFDVAALVRDTVHLYEQNAVTRGIALDVLIGDDVPGTAGGDPTRLRQVLSNLVSNAIKFTDYGTVTVTADTATADGDTFTLQIDVIDTGFGIAADAQAAIFEPFEQEDSSTTRRFGGSGLGLSISRRLVDMLGGQLTCVSLPGRGSTFSVALPLQRHVAPTPTPAADENARPAAPLHILVVEDNAVNLLILQTMLGKLGHTVDVAENGEIAVGLVAADHHDVVLMDCQMPVMDGYAATAAIRRLPGALACTPIVALTASAMPADKQRCLDAGMDAYLPKPINHADLIATLGNVSRQRDDTKV